MKARLFYIMLLLLLFIDSNAQIIEEINLKFATKQSLKNVVSDFLFVNENYPIDYGVDFYDILIDTFYRRSNCEIFFTSKELFFEIHIGLIPSYVHLLIKNDQKIYLINMRSSRDNIIEEINTLPNINPSFFNSIITEISRLHKKNWEANHSEEKYYIDEEGFMQPIMYNPAEW